MAKPMYDIIFRNCKHCNKEFMIEHPRQLYCCDKCRDEYNKTNDQHKKGTVKADIFLPK